MQIVLAFKTIAGRCTNHPQKLADINSAKTYFNKALSLQANHPTSLQAVAQIAQTEGKQSEADEIRVTLKEINPQLLEELDPAK